MHEFSSLQPSLRNKYLDGTSRVGIVRLTNQALPPCAAVSSVIKNSPAQLTFDRSSLSLRSSTPPMIGGQAWRFQCAAIACLILRFFDERERRGPPLATLAGPRVCWRLRPRLRRSTSRRASPAGSPCGGMRWVRRCGGYAAVLPPPNTGMYPSHRLRAPAGQSQMPDEGQNADAGLAKGRLSGHDWFFQGVGNAEVYVRQMRERSLPATCVAAGGS